MTSSLDISYITVEAIPKNKVETGIMSMKCEEHVVYGLLAGLKTYLKGVEATPFLLIKTNDSKGVSILNMDHTNILSITSYDGLTKTLCIFRDSVVDQKVAFDMIIELISDLTENDRVLVDGETVNVDTYTDLPEEFTGGKKSITPSTGTNQIKTVKKASVVAGPKVNCGQQQSANTVNSYYNNRNVWQSKPTFFKRNTDHPKKGALTSMKTKVLALAAGTFDAPEFPKLPKPKESAFGQHNNTQRHYGYCD